MATSEELVGALVVVGITYVDPSGAERQHQVAGVVEAIDDVITIRQRDGSAFTLPPAPDWFEATEPGLVYTLHATGEQVVDPAFSAMFTVEGAGPGEATA